MRANSGADNCSLRNAAMPQCVATMVFRLKGSHGLVCLIKAQSIWRGYFDHSSAQRAGEDRALAYLIQHGLRLVARNVRCPGGELDLVMQDDATLVFVEVRLRRSAAFGGAAASVTPVKQARLIKAAQFFLLRHSAPPPCRFDVIAIDGEALHWIKDAF